MSSSSPPPTCGSTASFRCPTSLSEAWLLALLELQHRLPADLSVGLEQWAALASGAVGAARAGGGVHAPVLRAVAVAPSAHNPRASCPPTRRCACRSARCCCCCGCRWQRELGHGTAGLTGKAQAASGDVWPSPSPSPPAADVCARTLAVQARMSQFAPPAAAPASAAARQRRRLLRALPLLRLLAAGAGRLYAHELELSDSSSAQTACRRRASPAAACRPPRSRAPLGCGRRSPPRCRSPRCSRAARRAHRGAGARHRRRRGEAAAAAAASAAAGRRLPTRRGHPRRREAPGARRSHGRCRRCRRWGSRCR